MAQLIDEMTVQVGLDPRDYTLVGFGGGGPLFLSALVMETEAAAGIVPLYPAVWSAFGGLYADVVHDYAKSCLGKLEVLDLDQLNTVCEELKSLAIADLLRDGYSITEAGLRFKLDLRYEGQSHEISIPLAGQPPFIRNHLAAARARFDAAHAQMFAHQRTDPCQLVTVRLSASVERSLDLPSSIPSPAQDTAGAAKTKIWLHGHDHALHASVFARDKLDRDSLVAGPAVIIEAQSHCLVPPGMQASIGTLGEILIERTAT